MADIPPTDALSEFDRFCRFIDGMHMGGFVENDFMCKAIQKKIREALLRADLSPPAPDDVAEALRYVRLFCGVHVKNVEDRAALTEKFTIIHRAASTPHVPSDDAFNYKFWMEKWEDEVNTHAEVMRDNARLRGELAASTPSAEVHAVSEEDKARALGDIDDVWPKLFTGLKSSTQDTIRTLLLPTTRGEG